MKPFGIPCCVRVKGLWCVNVHTICSVRDDLILYHQDIFNVSDLALLIKSNLKLDLTQSEIIH